MHQKLIEASTDESQLFDNCPLSMVQLDGTGRVMRINQQFLQESSLMMESVVGRRLTDLLVDPNPLITNQFISRLLQPWRPLQNALAK
jgi:PAS domain-containing protein